jgi:cation:H+ antiporter
LTYNITVSIFIFISQLVLMLWSANKFVDAASATAKHFGMPPLLIGMLIVGFGTSAPEMLVSAMASFQGNPGLALGNAYGSNIANIALVLGLTCLIRPITVHSSVLKKELPILLGVTLMAALQLWDGELSRMDAVFLLLIFIFLMSWSLFQVYRWNNKVLLSIEEEKSIDKNNMPLKKTLFWLFTGLAFLLISSHIMVWSAVEIAQFFGISDLIIGLTVVAIGTSLPELITSILAIYKKEHDIALGNVLGSNMFNTLVVVGIAGIIHPMPVPLEVLYRDCLVMGVLTLSLFIIGYGFKGQGRINRYEGAGLLAAYMGYNGWLALTVMGKISL